jgi:probable rRNA maturation factor
MAIAVTIQNRQRTRRINAPFLRRMVADLLVHKLALASAEVGVCLVADEQMTELNEGYLNHEGSTDVITFDYSERQTRNSKLASTIHGEIFVCVDEAIRQAKRFKTSWQSEVVRYAVHGVLHLLGHDDKHAKSRQKMKREENRLVAALAAEFSFVRLARS